MPKSVKIGVIIFWVVMCGWLIRYEWFPEKFTHSLSGYKGLLSSGPLVMDTWMRVEYNGVHVGFSHSKVDTPEDVPGIHYRVQNKTVLHLNILGGMQRILVESVANLDGLYRLQDMAFTMDSRHYRLDINAQRKSGEQFDVEMKTKAGKSQFSIRIPDDAIVYSPMLEMSLREMDPGDEMSIRLYEPVSMQAQQVLVKALRRETIIDFRGEKVEATVIESNLKGMSALSWIDGTGKTLRQETPMGWTMVASTSEEALHFSSEAREAGDILRSMAVPVRGTIFNPPALKSIDLRLLNPPSDLKSLVSSRLEILDDSSYSPTIRVHQGPSLGQGDASDTHTEEDLKATPFVQSDHPDILARATAVTKNATSVEDKIMALYTWTHVTIKKNPSINLPSALDVLKTGEGDCNEHTYLMVALARSLGIPARIQVGLLHHQGAFFYHAWPALHDGSGWIEMDPTTGQKYVDATHITLLHGEIADQMALLGLVGRLEIEVLSETYP